MLAILLMPLFLISLVPLLVSAVTQVASGWVALVSAGNALCACADLLEAGLVLVQIPTTARVRYRRLRLYWRAPDTLAA